MPKGLSAIIDMSMSKKPSKEDGDEDKSIREKMSERGQEASAKAMIAAISKDDPKALAQALKDYLEMRTF